LLEEDLLFTSFKGCLIFVGLIVLALLFC